ncbi:MAG: GNAT family N-acetyltransferase [Lewinellaceae bacterium]|nr:GNAT family N-acetyltransferase [Saprospiraceae bacterium]MCB9341053.1 GNAT family N-acetyltransferase [Lewinellaceae bacterium]
MSNTFSIVFPPSFYARYQVGGLTPGQMDEMLANGWFRNDVNVYTAAVRFMGDGWCSSVMLRLPLENFTWKKRLGKLLRRNQALFQVQIRPYIATQQKEDLWRVFKSTVHQWLLVPELSHHLFRELPATSFNTWELGVYHGGKLVAFSIFDKGRQSIASLEAAYDPAYAKYSLGIYTMLLEIAFAMEEGMAFYYPGFLPKGVPMFSYKLRPGGLEFFRLKEKRWVSCESLQPGDWLMEAVLARLEKLGRLIQGAGLVPMLSYGLFNHFPGVEVSPKGHNVLLVIGNPRFRSSNIVFLATWDIIRERFILFKARIPHPVQDNAKFPAGPAMQLFHIPEYGWLGEWREADRVVSELQKQISGPV